MRKCDLVRFLSDKHTIDEYKEIGVSIFTLQDGWDSDRLLFKSLSPGVLKIIDDVVKILANDKELAYAIAVVRIVEVSSKEFKQALTQISKAAKKVLPDSYKGYYELVAIEVAGGGYVGLGEDTFETLHEVARNYLVDLKALSQVCSIAYYYNMSVKELFKISRLHFRNVDEEFEQYGKFLVSYPNDVVLIENKDGSNEERNLLDMKELLNDLS